MIKRLAALALALLLLSASAGAEERYSTVEVNGMTEVLGEIKYENPDAGFVCWYAPGFFSLLWDTLADPQGQLMLYCSRAEGAPAYLTAERPEKNGLKGKAFLKAAAGEDGIPEDALSPIETYKSPEGDTFQFLSGTLDGIRYEYYSVRKKGKELLLRARCPEAAPDGLGVRLSHAVFSFDLC